MWSEEEEVEVLERKEERKRRLAKFRRRHRLKIEMELFFVFRSRKLHAFTAPFVVPLSQRIMLTSAVGGAGELLREARRDDCRRHCRDLGDEESMIAVAKPLLLLRQIALAATAPRAARRGAALAEQREEEIMPACMVTLILLSARERDGPARKE